MQKILNQAIIKAKSLKWGSVYQNNKKDWNFGKNLTKYLAKYWGWILECSITNPDEKSHHLDATNEHSWDLALQADNLLPLQYAGSLWKCNTESRRCI